MGYDFDKQRIADAVKRMDRERARERLKSNMQNKPMFIVILQLAIGVIAFIVCVTTYHIPVFISIFIAGLVAMVWWLVPIAVVLTIIDKLSNLDPAGFYNKLF